MSKTIYSKKRKTLHFNIDLLKETSPVIAKFIQDNPNSNNFTINLTDDENVLTKFEQLYQGKSIFFSKKRTYHYFNDLLKYYKLKTVQIA